MKLSYLVYRSIKNVKHFDDPSFTYSGFRKGEFNNDPDYANSINNVFAPLNEAISRLIDLHKIPLKVVELTEINKNGIVDLTSIMFDIKIIKNVLVLKDYGYERIPYSEFGKDKLLLRGYKAPEYPLYIQYIQNIPYFNEANIEFDEENEINVDVDLMERYNIDDGMCSYIIEYIQGKLLEDIAPELANMHITRAEQYFNDLDTPQTEFAQTHIKVKYGIE